MTYCERFSAEGRALESDEPDMLAWYVRFDDYRTAEQALRKIYELLDPRKSNRSREMAIIRQIAGTALGIT